MEPVNTIESPSMDTNRVQLLRNAMQAYSWRLKALSSNLANLDTPGYQRLSVKFEEKLQEVRHAIPGLRDVLDVKPRMEVHEDVPIIEDELMNLADVQMRDQFSAKALHDHFEMIRMGITGRS
ncbi:MAG: flagellar basal body protein [Rhodothermales bacterium]